MSLGLTVHDRLVEFVETPRVTFPVNPLTAPTLMVAVAATLGFVDTLEGLAAMVKSWTLYETVVE